MIIYKIVNLVNHKVYIGQTIRGLRERWRQHVYNARHGSDYAIHAAIRKYGEDNFELEIIDTADDRDELDSKEIYWIQVYNSMSPNGYNLCSGGKTPRMTPEIRYKLSGENHWTRNRSFSNETLKKKHDALYRKPSGQSKPVRCVETGEVFYCAKEFEYRYGHSLTKIIACCKGRRKTHHGYHWEYVKQEA